MSFLPTTSLQKIAKLTKRIRAIQGGTSASKTISVLMLLINDCQVKKEEPELTSVVSESMPHLKKGAIRDFLSIMQSHGYYRDERWNKSDFIYTFETGNKLEFFSADQPNKVRGPRRDNLFINECNNIKYEAFDQLEVRTKNVIYLDWNPTVEFWYNEKVATRSDVDFVIVTYKDNEGLSQNIINSIEQHKADAGWWKVYGLGELGEVTSLIYKGWRVLDEVPFEARLERYGLDYGYSNDPTAIVAVYYYNGGYIWDEIVFQKGLSNKQIADYLLNLPKAVVIADSAEPKSNDEIKSYGIDVIGSVKGQGSVEYGIQWVQSQKISVTKRSVNILKERSRYVWLTDANGNLTSIPDHAWSHSMDAGRYAMESLRPEGDDDQERADRLMSRLRNTQLQTK